jgi:hypothetical protein
MGSRESKKEKNNEEEEKEEVISDDDKKNPDVALCVCVHQINRLEIQKKYLSLQLMGASFCDPRDYLKKSLCECEEELKRKRARQLILYYMVKERDEQIEETEKKRKEFEEIKKKEIKRHEKPKELIEMEIRIIDFKLANIEIDYSFYLLHRNDPNFSHFANNEMTSLDIERQSLEKQKNELLSSLT